MHEDDSVGRRIARIRKGRGLTQTALSSEAGVSLSMLKKVESGHASASTSWIGAVALALRVDTARITGGIEEGPDQVHSLVPQLRRALATTDVFDDDIRPGDLARLRGEVVRLGAMRRNARYTTIGAQLPTLIETLLVTGQTEGEPAYVLLSGAYRAANTLGHKLGYADLSLLALDRMEWAAGKAGDPLLGAMTQYLRAAQLGRIGAERQALALLERTIGELEPMVGVNVEAAAVQSALLMKAGVIAATVGRGDDAAAYLRAAAEHAARVGDRVVHETVVGPTNVRLHELAAAVDLGEAGRGVEIAQNTHLPDGFASERTTYFHMDHARALLGIGETDAAIEALYDARQAADEHFKVSKAVKVAIRTAADQQRYATNSLRRLAIQAGVDD